MKKKFLIFSVILLTLLLSAATLSCDASNVGNNEYEDKEVKQCVITYVAGNGGYLYVGNSGEKHKTYSCTVDFGTSLPFTVQAFPESGYTFSGWSDGYRTMSRNETNVCEDITLTAYFVKKAVASPKVSFSLNYRGGKSDEEICDISFDKNNFKQKKFPIPTKEHFTFKGWFIDDQKVANEKGNMLIGEQLLNFTDREIRAKWQANETFVHKTLLVYVTRVKAEVPNDDLSKNISVDYTMDEAQKAFCKFTTARVELLLEEALEGLVDFQIDEYYTKELMNESNLGMGRYAEHGKPGGYYHYIDCRKIPEIKDILGNYDTILSIHSFNDREPFQTTGLVGGVTTGISGAIMFDRFLDCAESNGFSLDEALRIINSGEFVKRQDKRLKEGFDHFLYTIIHEMAHQIDSKIGQGDYHNVIWSMGSGTSATLDYYRNEAVMEGKVYGFPYEYWRGDKICKIKYRFTDGGNVKTSKTCIIQSYMSVEVRSIEGFPVTATAIPDEGYKFVGWSDGVTTAVRTDTFYEDYEVTALFELTQ